LHESKTAASGRRYSSSNNGLVAALFAACQQVCEVDPVIDRYLLGPFAGIKAG
jgi:hypothetical protein